MKKNPPGFYREPLTQWFKEDNRQKMKNVLSEIKSALPIFFEHRFGSGEVVFSFNPASRRQVIGVLRITSEEEVDAAMRAAYKSWTDWAKTPATERAKKLLAAADIIQAKRFELAALIVLETGKIWSEADADVAEAIDYLRLYAQSCREYYAEPFLVEEVSGERNEIYFEPIGVFAVLSVWNFPLAISAGMTSAALAAGNTVVFKPAWQSAVIGAKLAEMYWQAGIPKDVFNIVFGSSENENVGQALVRHPLTARIAFTGSLVAGLNIMEDCQRYPCDYTFIKKLEPGEFGGKGKMIIDSDFDLDEAVRYVRNSAFGYAGQKCSANTITIIIDSSRDRAFYRRFCRRLVEAIDSIKIGNPEDPNVFIGPLISEEQLERVRQYVRIGKTEGKVLYEGKISEELVKQGYYHAPVIFTDVPTKARIYQEEIFGPVLVVNRADNLDGAIEMFNDSRYALTGGICTKLDSHAERAIRECNVGNFYINREITGAVVGRQPFGGWKGSGLGSKAGTAEYIEGFMHRKTLSRNLTKRGMSF